MASMIKSTELPELLNNTKPTLEILPAYFGSRGDKSAYSMLSPPSHPFSLDSARACQWMCTDEGIILLTSAKVDLKYKPINSLHFSC